MNPLTVGDKVPDIELKQIINFPVSSAKLSAFQGKAIILDFWASWCAPCIAVMPKLAILQRKNQAKLQILSVTRDDKATAYKILSKLKETDNINFITSVVADTILTNMFKPQGIPYYVWIDSKGEIRAITGTEQVTQENIDRLVKGEFIEGSLPQKAITPDYDKPYFSQQILPGAQALYQSVLTKYIPGLSASITLRKNWLRSINATVIRLYQLALGQLDVSYFSNDRVILEGFNSKMDSLAVGYYDSSAIKLWKEVRFNFLYNYELVFEDTTLGKKQLCDFMLQDLNRLFGMKGITGKIETRKTRVFALVRTSNEEKFKTKSGPPVNQQTALGIEIINRPISALISRLNLWTSNLKIHTVKDETGYKNNIDINIDLSAGIKDIASMNKILSPYALRLDEKEMEMQMIVLTKAK